MVYAGFWRRLCAHFIDLSILTLILNVVFIFIGIVVGINLIPNAEQRAAMQHHSSNRVVQKIIPVANDYATPYPEYSKPNAAPVTAAPTAAVPASSSDVAPAISPSATPASPDAPGAASVPSTSPDAQDMSEPVPYDGQGHHSMHMDEGNDDAEPSASQLLMMMTMMYGGLIILLIPVYIAIAIYHAAFVSGKWQATPGKRVMGCMVITKDGRRLKFMHALGRHIACILSSLTLLIGYFLIGWTRQKTGLQDLVAGTRVVRFKNSLPVIATSKDEV